MQVNREKKLKKLLVVEVSNALLDEVSLVNDTFVTVMGAQLSPTLEHATIYISVLPLDKSEAVLEKLNHRIYSIQQVLNKRLNLRIVPKIRFEIDTTEERAQKIEELLEKVKDE